MLNTTLLSYRVIVVKGRKSSKYVFLICGGVFVCVSHCGWHRCLSSFHCSQSHDGQGGFHTYDRGRVTRLAWGPKWVMWALWEIRLDLISAVISVKPRSHRSDHSGGLELFFFVLFFAVISSWKRAAFILSRGVWKTPLRWVIHQADHLGCFIYVSLLQTDVTLPNVRSYSELDLFGELFRGRLKSWRLWHPRLQAAKKALHLRCGDLPQRKIMFATGRLMVTFCNLKKKSVKNRSFLKRK